jgi:prepilin-type N-terminal cleavage/methylation domain-containing protein
VNDHSTMSPDRATRTSDRGFTLVELLIVIVILGVLSTVAVFAVRGISNRGESAACAADYKTLETAIETWRVSHPGTDAVTQADLVAAGLLRTPSTRWVVVDALTITPAVGSGCTSNANVAQAAGAATTVAAITTTTVAATTTTAASAVGNCKPNEWYVEWFANTGLTGSPTTTTCATKIDNAWGSGSPGVNGIGSDRFSVRWTRRFQGNASTYSFETTTDDGMRVKVDGRAVIDSWRDQADTKYTGSIDVASGQHTVIVEFYENGGIATAKVAMEID